MVEFIGQHWMKTLALKECLRKPAIALARHPKIAFIGVNKYILIYTLILAPITSARIFFASNFWDALPGITTDAPNEKKFHYLLPL